MLNAEKFLEEIKDVEVQTTVNEEPIEILVEEGEIENVCN